jgi:hypothetical protein
MIKELLKYTHILSTLIDIGPTIKNEAQVKLPFSGISIKPGYYVR